MSSQSKRSPKNMSLFLLQIRRENVWNNEIAMFTNEGPLCPEIRYPSLGVSY